MLWLISINSAWSLFRRQGFSCGSFDPVAGFDRLRLFGNRIITGLTLLLAGFAFRERIRFLAEVAVDSSPLGSSIRSLLIVGLYLCRIIIVRLFLLLLFFVNQLCLFIVLGGAIAFLER